MLSSEHADANATRSERVMRSTIGAALCASLAMACGPEAADEPEAPGVLEYEHPYTRLYRLGPRIDIVQEEGDVEVRACGMLTERAYTELEDTLAALDPSEDYGHDPQAEDCTPGAWVHIEGFEHSPFECDFQCCRRELTRAGVIYFLVDSYFAGFEDPLVFDGVPYVVIEPDEPCPMSANRES
jgi:hypothetical protein